METVRRSLLLALAAGVIVLAGCSTPSSGQRDVKTTGRSVKKEASKLTPEQENVLVRIQYMEQCIVELRKEAKCLQRIKDFTGASRKLDKAAKLGKALEELRKKAPDLK